MTAFAVRATPSTIATQASRQALKPATLLAPGIVTVFAAYKYVFALFFFFPLTKTINTTIKECT